MPVRALLVVNPHATAVSEIARGVAERSLAASANLSVAHTQRQGHAVELVQAGVRDGVDLVVVLGGDGTVNEAANALEGTGVPLACLPGGSNNVFAKAIGVPAEFATAVERLCSVLDGSADADALPTRRVDLGRVNGRWFTFAAGMGLDASVVERVDRHPRLKTRFGPWYFAEAAVATFLSTYVRRPPRLRIDVDGQQFDAVSLFVQNGRPYTYFGRRPVELVEDEHDSGELAAVALTRARATDVPGVTVRALTSAAHVARHSAVEALPAFTRLTARSADGRPVALQVDGDHVEDATEATFSVAAGALTVLAPTA